MRKLHLDIQKFIDPTQDSMVGRKIAIFFPPGGSGKLIYAIVEILLGNTSIVGPTHHGSMHVDSAYRFRKSILNLPFYHNDSPDGTHSNYELPPPFIKYTHDCVMVGHITGKEIKTNIDLLSDFEIIYIYVTSITDAINMANRNMYKYVKAEFTTNNKRNEVSKMFSIPEPDCFEDIADDILERWALDTACNTSKDYIPLYQDIKNILQLDYGKLLVDDSVVTTISEFLGFSENIKQAKSVYNQYIISQQGCPEYATLASINKFK